MLFNTSIKDKITDGRKEMPFVYAKVLDFHPSVTELHIFDGGHEDKKQSDNLNVMIGTIKDFAN